MQKRIAASGGFIMPLPPYGPPMHPPDAAICPGVAEHQLSCAHVR